jgi:primosomal protein N' (replication factor Y)
MSTGLPPPPLARIARAIPLTRTRAVRGRFDYRLSAEQALRASVGSVLRVRFGPRRELAVIAELVARSELTEERLREPEAVLEPPLPADLVVLAEWIAHEYCSTPARALAPMLPPGIGTGMRAKRRLVAHLTDAGAAALGGGVRLTDVQRRLLEALVGEGPAPASQLGTPALRRLQTRGLVDLREEVLRRVPAGHRVGSETAEPTPTAEQRAALEAVLHAMSPDLEAAERRLLLQGVTGSGKTEVYLRAVQSVLEAGRGAIVLVPEIALTPQTLSRFRRRFGDVVAVIHSGLAQGERYDEWLRLAAGQARVCVGPRSAVFAPIRDIGLIIVDEEHESSYKHEGDPRYDARTVAARRAEVHGAVLLCGSATPRPESVHGLARVMLRERVDGRALPEVEILDMRGLHHPLHPATSEALAGLRREGGKAIVLLNRRGWSNFLTCRSCGRVWMCPNCEVALVLHRQGGHLGCHHCGHREPIPERCRACGSVSVARHGAGTERVEHELARALGERDFPVLRLDADAGAQARAATLERFGAAAAGILVGTQMVAKGHDFPDVALGVVLDADSTLRFPDFRAEERTFALITQLAGRAGRAGEHHGRVLVQTLAPETSCIGLAARHDTDGFIAAELERRRLLRYPPFATAIRIVCSAPEPAAPGTATTALRELIDAPDAQILGPAPLFALRGRYRSQLVIKAGRRTAAIEAVGAAVDGFVGTRAARGVSVSVDVDPQ